MFTKAREQGNSIEINIPLNVAEKYGIVNGSIIEIEKKKTVYISNRLKRIHR